MKSFLLLLVIIFLMNGVKGEEGCFIYLNPDDVGNLISTFPPQILKNTPHNYVELKDFRLKALAPQQITFQFRVVIKKWEKIPILGIKQTLGLNFMVTLRVTIVNKPDQIAFSLDLPGIHKEFQDLIFRFMHGLVRQTFEINAQNKILGARMALYVGAAPQALPLSHSYIHPDASHLANLLKNQILQKPEELSRYGLAYSKEKDCLTVIKATPCPGGERIELIESELSFPQLTIENNRLLLTVTLKFKQLKFKRNQGEECFPESTIGCSLPVRWKLEGEFLAFELADQNGEVKFLHSSNTALDIMANTINLAFKEDLRSAIAKLRIPKDKLNLKVSICNQQKIFQFASSLIHEQKFFFFYQLQK